MNKNQSVAMTETWYLVSEVDGLVVADFAGQLRHKFFHSSWIVCDQQFPLQLTEF